MPIHRVFLDWREPALPSVASYLRARYAAKHLLDLQNVMIALPGGRAGRRLLEILVDIAETQHLALIPPRITTIGQLAEGLYQAPLPFANALTQQLAWVEALHRADPAELAPLTPHLPAEADLFAHLTFVERLMALDRELAGSRLRFADVATSEPISRSPREAARWQALATLQSHYHEALEARGFAEPQHARLRAIDQHACRTAYDIIVVGVVDLNATQRALLDQVADHVTALVVSPPTLADRFDAYGCVRPEAWQQADLPLDNVNVVFCDGPGDQADEALRALAGLNGAFAADDITIGVPDPGLAPHLQQRLEAHQLPFRYGVGTPTLHADPCRFLRGVAAFLDGNGYADFANLVRHPAMDAWLGKQEIAGSWLEELDDYYRTHLPTRLTGRWLSGPRAHTALHRAFAAIESLLAPFRGSAQHPQDWSQAILTCLSNVYGDGQDLWDDDTEHMLATVCEQIQVALRDVVQIPDTLAPRVTGAAAIRLLLHALQGCAVPPRFDQSAIELLGWLELPLDDAPAVIVTGFNEGIAPASQSSDLFLPEPLRVELGLLDNAQRYARDAYNLSLLAAPRTHLTLIVGRRTLDNDVLLPSRLLFACDDDRLLARTHAAFSPSAHPAPQPLSASTLKPGRTRAAWGSPQPQALPAPMTSMRITAFRDYLLCPYRYYLKHHLGLHAVDTTAEEMSPPAFGDLLHRVLQEFAASPVAESDRAAAIRDQLHSTLDECVLTSYGNTPLPAVRVQVEQARLRLDRFAQWQADWRREGWRIEHAEVDVNGQRAWLDVDGEPMYLRGRIDRIDIHETTQERLVLDYKTGESGRTPEAAHRQRQSDWTDLQLPLYRHLVKGLGLSDALQLGYLMLPKTLSDIGVSRAAWSPDELAQADAVAADIVRRVRAEAFWPPARLTGAHDEFAVLCQASRHHTLDTAALAKERATR